MKKHLKFLAGAGCETLSTSLNWLNGKKAEAVCRNGSIGCRRFNGLFIFMAMLIISGQVVFTSSLSCTDLNYSVQSAIENKQKAKQPVPLILVLSL